MIKPSEFDGERLNRRQHSRDQSTLHINRAWQQGWRAVIYNHYRTGCAWTAAEFKDYVRHGKLIGTIRAPTDGFPIIENSSGLIVICGRGVSQAAVPVTTIAASIRARIVGDRRAQNSIRPSVLLAATSIDARSRYSMAPPNVLQSFYLLTPQPYTNDRSWLPFISRSPATCAAPDAALRLKQYVNDVASGADPARFRTKPIVNPFC